MAKVMQETGRGFNVTDPTSVVLQSAVATSPKTTLFQQTIKGGKMGTLKTLDFRALFLLTTPAISVPVLTITVEFGSSVLTLVSSIGVAINQTNAPFLITGQIINKAANGQVAHARIEQNASTIPLSLGANSGFKASDWTEDTSLDRDLIITGQFSALALGSSLTLKHAAVELS